MNIEALNFHHLRYFWAVAKDGNLTRTAKRLRVAQSALSSQIRQLEDSLGEPLFVRQRGRLKLSESGQVALQHAEEIFASGEELVSTLREGRGREHVLRVGGVSTLSRNFQESFLKPLLLEPGLRLRLRSGRLPDLLASLQGHELDVVLSNRAVHAASEGAGRSSWRCRRIARQEVSVVGRKERRPFRFDVDMGRVPVIVPGPDHELRSEFDALCAQRGVAVTVHAEVDDMAMMRLLARDMDAVAVLPSIVVRDEIKSGQLCELAEVPGLFESFYAITMPRRFQHPLLRALLGRAEEELLAMEAPRRAPPARPSKAPPRRKR